MRSVNCARPSAGAWNASRTSPWARLRSMRSVSPCRSTARDLPAGAEAVVDRAAGEALAPQRGVDTAPVVALQVGAGRPGPLVEREVGGAGEGQGDTAEPEALAAVTAQAGAADCPLSHIAQPIDTQVCRERIRLLSAPSTPHVTWITKDL
jgi:hypothetical protein